MTTGPATNFGRRASDKVAMRTPPSLFLPCPAARANSTTSSWPQAGKTTSLAPNPINARVAAESFSL
ncbi:MAG: hypothetical protein OXQ89_07295 [Rhodospirillaceae bacterium]|nr:hypothetical protein [Rhodospirillaceae bacterium]